MRILALSDFHNHYALLPHLERLAQDADIVIDAGDFTVFEDEMEETLRRYASWGKPILLIHGNHESAPSVEKACARTQGAVRFLHQQDIDILGVRIIGWGGGGFNEYDGRFESWTASLLRDDRPTILVTHPPPSGTTLDLTDSNHVGSKSLRAFIERFQPDFSLSGHIHYTQGAEDRIGRTRCINLGPKGRIIDIEPDEGQ
jgi:Icc-related predicted phosphoesterase